MMTQPVELRTQRLVLRPVAMCDADEIEALVSERDVAKTTLSIPHPYPKGGAAEYIRDQLPKAEAGEAAQFMARTIHDGTLVGGIGLSIEVNHRRAEIGYWVGKPFWNTGYCTEAAAGVLDYAFRVLKLNRVFAHHMLVNPASGRVMQKIGMKHEATLREHIVRLGAAQDIAIYGMTRGDYDSLAPVIHKDAQ